MDPETIEKELFAKLCTQESISVDPTEIQSPPQAFDYGNEEWEQFHQHAWNTIESESQQLKASGDEDIATTGRRRVRELAAAQIMITMLVANHNIRQIAAFICDQNKARSEAGTAAPILRRRDRVWSNRYTKSTGNGDSTIPGRNKKATSTAEPGTDSSGSPPTPLRT